MAFAARGFYYANERPRPIYDCTAQGRSAPSPTIAQRKPCQHWHMLISELTPLTGSAHRKLLASTDAEQLQRVHLMAYNRPRLTTDECQQQLIVILVCGPQGRKLASPHIIAPPPGCRDFPRRTSAVPSCAKARRPSCTSDVRCHSETGESKPDRGESAAISSGGKVALFPHHCVFPKRCANWTPASVQLQPMFLSDL